MHSQHAFGCEVFLILFIWIGLRGATGEHAAWVAPTPRRTESRKAIATQTLGTSLLQHRTEQSTILEQEKKRKHGHRHEVSKKDKPRKVLSNLHTKRHRVKSNRADEGENDEDMKPSIISALIYKLLTLSVVAVAAIWYCKGGAWVAMQAREGGAWVAMQSREIASKLKDGNRGQTGKETESEEKLADKQESDEKVTGDEKQEDADTDDGASASTDAASTDKAMNIDDPKESSLDVNAVAQQKEKEEDGPSSTTEMTSNEQGQLDHEQEKDQQDEEPEQSMPKQTAPHVTEIVYQLTDPSAMVSYVTFVMSDGSENRNDTKSATIGDPVRHPVDENDPIVAVAQFGYYRGYFGAAFEFTTLSGKTILAANKTFKERTCKIERAAQPGKMITNLGFDRSKLHHIEEVSKEEETQPSEGSSQKSKAKKKATKDAKKPKVVKPSQPYDEKADVEDDKAVSDAESSSSRNKAVSEAGSSSSRKVPLGDRLDAMKELKQLQAKQEQRKTLEEERSEAVAKMQSLAAEHADLREQEDAAEKAFKLLPFKDRNKAAKNLGDGFANASWRARVAAASQETKKDKAGVKSKSSKSKKLDQPSTEATQKEQNQKQDASGDDGQKQELPGEEQSRDAAATSEETPKVQSKAQPEPQVNLSKPQNSSVTQSHSLTRSDCDSESFIFDGSELDLESLDGALQEFRGDESPQ